MNIFSECVWVQEWEKIMFYFRLKDKGVWKSVLLTDWIPNILHRPPADKIMFCNVNYK